MKKILCTLGVVAMASSLFAQGTLTFANSSSSKIQFAATQGGAATDVAAGGGMAELYWAPTGTAYTPWTPSMTPAAWLTANPGWTLAAGSTKAVGPAAGRFNAGALTIPTAAPGGTIDAVVAAWQGSATTFAAAYTAATPGSANGVGVSGKFTVATSNPNTVPPPPPASIVIPANIVTSPVSAVPEPTTLALLGLGGVALLIARRRK